jgi:predicted negative regulator of RcsB-dependent stress response
VARITRKELKTDKFALEVSQTFDFFDEHRKEVLRYGSIAVAIVLLGFAINFYRGHQHTVRQQALADAIRIQEAPVGGAAPGTLVSFATQPEKDAAALKAFTGLITSYPGSEEAIIAQNYLAAIAVDQGKLDEAVKRFQQVADSGDKRLSSLAKLSLAQVYLVQGKNKEAQDLLRWLVDHPTEFVSKEQATFTLARALAKSNQKEALKLVEPLRTSSSSTISQDAINLYAELSQPSQ